MKAGQDFLTWSYKVCNEDKTSTPESCSAEMNKNFEIWMKPNLGNIGFISLVPIPKVWILVFVCMRVFRWVKAGEVQ